jgi:hypothetical protein
VACSWPAKRSQPLLKSGTTVAQGSSVAAHEAMMRSRCVPLAHRPAHRKGKGRFHHQNRGTAKIAPTTPNNNPPDKKQNITSAGCSRPAVLGASGPKSWSLAATEWAAQEGACDLETMTLVRAPRLPVCSDHATAKS